MLFQKIIFTIFLTLIISILQCSSDSVRKKEIKEIPENSKTKIIFTDFSGLEKNEKDLAISRLIPEMIIEDLVYTGLMKGIEQELRIFVMHELDIPNMRLEDKKGLVLASKCFSEYMISGSILEAGNSYSVTINLFDVKNKKILLSQKYISAKENIVFREKPISILKQASFDILNTLYPSQLNKNEIELIQNNYSTKNQEAAIENFSGELKIEKSMLLELKLNQKKKK